MIFATRADNQTKLNSALGQLPVNKDSAVGDDPFLEAGFNVISEAKDLAQFFDRGCPGGDGQGGDGGLPRVHGMVKPDRLDAILTRLEKARQRIY